MVNFAFGFFETLIQEFVTHCHHYLVRECHVLQSLLQNCTCPGHIDRAEQLAVNHRWRHLFGLSVQLTVDNETSKSWSALMYRSRKIRSPTVRQCTFFTTESGRNVVAYGWMTTLSTSPDDVLSADIGVLLLDVGVFVSGMAISHCFCKLASAGGWWKLTDRHCLDCPLHA